MPAAPVISVDKIGKVFCRDLKKSLWYGLLDSLGEAAPFLARKTAPDGTLRLRAGEFPANREVSFSLEQGECVGLIGHNGAGKTTLLKMLNGLIKPDQGSITIRGRVGALIALGAGFNPILSGRENLYINGSVLGLTRREMDAKYDEIVAFAELQEFMDVPVQNYSSGMQVRLGFAVATALQPDVLLVDEVLAVGDLNFRMKCVARISELIRANTTVILVSHSMVDIQRVCNRAIVMDHGQMVFDGEVSEGIARYESLGLAQNRDSQAGSSALQAVALRGFTLGPAGAEPRRILPVRTGDPLSIRFHLEVAAPIDDARVRIFLESAKAGLLVSKSSAAETPLRRLEPGLHSFELAIPSFPFLVGAFAVGIGVYGNIDKLLLDRPNQGVIEVTGPEIKTGARGNAGLLDLPTQWRWNYVHAHPSA